MKRLFSAKRIFSFILCLSIISTVFCMPMYADTSNNDYDINENGVLIKYNGNGINITIPSNVTAIAKSAFEGCTTIVNVTLPSSIKSINDMAFYKCSNLKTVLIPKTVTLIGTGMFSFNSTTQILCEKGSYAEKYAIQEQYCYKIIYLYVDNTPPTITTKFYYKTIKVNKKSKKVLYKVTATITDKHLYEKDVYYKGIWYPWQSFNGVFTKKGNYIIRGIDEKKNTSKKAFTIG